MKAKCEWERFTRTGRIEDYLSFKAKEGQPEEASKEERTSGKKRAGEWAYAGFRDRYGNGDQNDTCR